MIARVRSAPPQVIHFGASESLFASPSDTDRRLLPQLIEAGLPGVSFYSIAGAGYQPRLLRAYVDLLAAFPDRPVVVLGLCVRIGFTPWRDHPAYAYQREADAVSAIDPHRPIRLIRSALPRPSEQEMITHDRRSFPTLAGDLTIGEYRRQLKDPRAAGLSDQQAERLLYGYHHGAVLGPDDPWLLEVSALGRTLREHGFPVVGYHMPVPVQRGVDLFGEVFRDRTVASLSALDAAFRAGYGPVEIVQTGALLGSGDFIDPADATEHVNQNGRLAIAEPVAAAVRSVLQVSR